MSLSRNPGSAYMAFHGYVHKEIILLRQCHVPSFNRTYAFGCSYPRMAIGIKSYIIYMVVQQPSATEKHRIGAIGFIAMGFISHEPLFCTYPQSAIGSIIYTGNKNSR